MKRWHRPLFRRAAAVILSLLTVLCVSMVTRPLLTAAGAGISINTRQVTLYGLESWAEAYIDIPSGYATRCQLRVSGASHVTYTADSSAVEVSSGGLITAAHETPCAYASVGTRTAAASYRMSFGTSVITVEADGQRFAVSVTLRDYADIYADKVMDDYLSANITAGMTTRAKIEKIARFIAARHYDAAYSSAAGLIVTGGADCWGSTDCAIRMAEKIGLAAWSRNGSRDTGAGSAHMNAMISDGKEYYELEAGYTGKAPRSYDIRKRDSLFSYRDTANGIEVYQYDGAAMPEVLTVPSSIGGRKVVGIGSKFLQMDKTVREVVLPSTLQYIGDSAFNSCHALEKIHFPASLERIGRFVFTDCRSLQTVRIPSGSRFAFVGGALYQGTTLLYCPNAALTAPRSGTTAIADYAFYYNSRLTSFTVPASVRTIGEGAFGYCTRLTEIDWQSRQVTAVPDYCFAYTNINHVVLPDSVTAIGTRAFDVSGADDRVVLIGRPGSVTETYAGANGHRFVDVSQMLYNTSFVSSSYAVVGDTVKVTPAYSGGKAPYTCAVSCQYGSDGGSDSRLTDNAVHLTQTGTCTVSIVVTDGSGIKAEKRIPITVRDKLTGKASLSASSLTCGKALTVTASAAGGHGGYRYALYYRTADNTAWLCAAALGTNNVMTFTPPADGRYTLRVTVKDVKGKTAYVYPGAVTVNPPALKNTSTLSASAITLGSSVTVNGSATGGGGSYQYALSYKSAADESYRSAAALSGSSKMTFTPPAAGQYTLRVAVKDSRKKTACLYLTLTVSPPALKNTSTLSAAAVTLGSSVTVNGSAAGGGGGYQYALYYQSPYNTAWQCAAALSADNVMTFTPPAAGQYTLRVAVKDSQKKTACLYLTLTVSPPALKNTSTLSAAAVTLGSSVTVNGSATGGSGGYQYALSYKEMSAETYRSAVSWSGSSKMTITPSACGQYSLCVAVRDSRQKTAYTYLTVTVRKK